VRRRTAAGLSFRRGHRGWKQFCRRADSFAWLDTGNPDALMEAANYIATIQKRQGLYVSCIEEIAYKRGFINREQLKKVAQDLLKTPYGEYLMEIAEGK